MVKRNKVQKINNSLDQKQQTAILLTVPLGTAVFFSHVCCERRSVLRAESKSSETKFECHVHHATANLTGVNFFNPQTDENVQLRLKTIRKGFSVITLKEIGRNHFILENPLYFLSFFF